MSTRIYVGFIATALSAGLLGWLLREGYQVETAALAAPCNVDASIASSPVSLTPVAKKPLILISRDGNVTLHVEQQPLEWVLNEMARQSGWEELRAPSCAKVWQQGPMAPPAVSDLVAKGNLASTTPLTPPINPLPSDVWQLQDLLTASSSGVVGEGTELKNLYESNAPDEMRLLAFETYLGPLSGDRSQLRQALEAAMGLSNAAVQAEARKRLEELNDREYADAPMEP